MNAFSKGRCHQIRQILPSMLIFLPVPDKHVVWNANQLSLNKFIIHPTLERNL
jgi:hypothetical protein